MRGRVSWLFYLLVVLPPPGEAQTAPPLVAVQGLDLLAKGHADSAVALWTITWAPDDTAKRQMLRDSFRQLPQAAGAVLGYDLIRTIDITPHLQRVYVLLRCERQPVYLMLVVYQAKDRWTVTTVNWHTDADHVLPPTLVGAEHPTRP